MLRRREAKISRLLGVLLDDISLDISPPKEFATAQLMPMSALKSALQSSPSDSQAPAQVGTLSKWRRRHQPDDPEKHLRRLIPVEESITVSSDSVASCGPTDYESRSTSGT